MWLEWGLFREEEGEPRRWAQGRSGWWHGKVGGTLVGCVTGGEGRGRAVRPYSRPCWWQLSKLNDLGWQAAETKEGFGHAAIPWKGCVGWIREARDGGNSSRNKTESGIESDQFMQKKKQISKFQELMCHLKFWLEFWLTALIQSLCPSFFIQSLVYWRLPSSLKAVLQTLWKIIWLFIYFAQLRPWLQHHWLPTNWSSNCFVLAPGTEQAGKTKVTERMDEFHLTNRGTVMARFSSNSEHWTMVWSGCTVREALGGPFSWRCLRAWAAEHRMWSPRGPPWGKPGWENFQGPNQLKSSWR